MSDRKKNRLTISATLASDNDFFTLNDKVDVCFPPTLCFSSENMSVRRRSTVW